MTAGGDRTVDAALDEMYDRVPVIDCIGVCRHTCTVIEMSQREHQRIAERGVQLAQPAHRVDFAEPTPCPALGAFGQCTVHDIRPMVCRIWGVVEDLSCPHGCTPAEYLTHAEAMELMAASYEVGGPPPRMGPVSVEALRRSLGDPAVGQAVAGLLRRGAAADRRKAGR
jgi:Fe-S-cluster containining protein